MNKKMLYILAVTTALPLSALGKNTFARLTGEVSDDAIAEQRVVLKVNTLEKGYGPQAPRDIESTAGRNGVIFSAAPASSQMNLCNIHFHKNAEHKGGEFTKYAGNGDGEGYMSGFQYSGKLTAAEKAPIEQDVCLGEHGGLQPGDTIEAHYVYSTAKVTPGPGLEACLDKATLNPQLRVEA